MAPLISTSHTLTSPTAALKLLVLIALPFASISSWANAGSAAQKEHRFPISIAQVQANEERRFARIDVDGSGLIDLAEYELAKPAGRDARGRGRHGAAKMRASNQRSHQLKGARGAKRKAFRQATQDELFVLLDTDANGTLSDTEFSAKTRDHVHTARQRAGFKRRDANSDGTLSLDEFHQRSARLSAADTDADGQVTKAEMRAHRKSSRAQG